MGTCEFCKEETTGKTIVYKTPGKEEYLIFHPYCYQIWREGCVVDNKKDDKQGN